jgi:hypothetical protein
VATQALAVRLGRVGGDVTLGVGELASRRLGALPLLAVLGDELAELAGVAEDGSIAGIAVDGAFSEGGTEVLQTGADGEVIELGRDGRHQERCEKSLGLHGAGGEGSHERTAV